MKFFNSLLIVLAISTSISASALTAAERQQIITNITALGPVLQQIANNNGVDIRDIDPVSGVGYCMGSSTTLLELIRERHPNYNIDMGYNGMSHYYLRFFDFYGAGQHLYIDPSYQQFLDPTYKSAHPELPLMFIGSRAEYRTMLTTLAGMNYSARDTYGHELPPGMVDDMLRHFLDHFQRPAEGGYATFGFDRRARR